jgi:hypothetical protein
MSLAGSLLQALSLGLLAVAADLVWKYIHSPIKNIPGPFLAKFTNLWRLVNVYNGRAELTERQLHEQYGTAVRLGPNIVSLSDPKLLRTIYSTHGDFLKVSFHVSRLDVNLSSGRAIFTLSMIPKLAGQPLRIFSALKAMNSMPKTSAKSPNFTECPAYCLLNL